MNELIVPAAILALIFTGVAIAYLSNYIGRIGACRMFEAERNTRKKAGLTGNP